MRAFVVFVCYLVLVMTTMNVVQAYDWSQWRRIDNYRGILKGPIGHACFADQNCIEAWQDAVNAVLVQYLEDNNNQIRRNLRGEGDQQEPEQQEQHQGERKTYVDDSSCDLMACARTGSEYVCQLYINLKCGNNQQRNLRDGDEDDDDDDRPSRTTDQSSTTTASITDTEVVDNYNDTCWVDTWSFISNSFAYKVKRRVPSQYLFPNELEVKLQYRNC